MVQPVHRGEDRGDVERQIVVGGHAGRQRAELVTDFGIGRPGDDGSQAFTIRPRRAARDDRPGLGFLGLVGQGLAGREGQHPGALRLRLRVDMLAHGDAQRVQVELFPRHHRLRNHGQSRAVGQGLETVRARRAGAAPARLARLLVIDDPIFDHRLNSWMEIWGELI